MSRRVRVAHAIGVLVCAALAVAHQTVRLSGWYIEDSAISFAYARNLSNGLGLVAWSGGERVEGYSNPTWVGLLAVLEWCGADAMLAAKWVAGGLAAATVGLVYLLCRECVPARWREVPLLASALLAADPQFAIWGACGLENPLFSCLLAAALTRSLVESRTDGRPWSAGLWFLLAITRPEGLAYCAVGLLLAVFSRPLRWRRAIGWVALFAAPFAVYHAARYAYFAWPFPMTYYAKVETKDPNVLRWIPNRGWAYVRDWALQTGRGLFVLAWVPAVVGRERWRLIASALALTALAAAWLFPEQVLGGSAVAVGVPAALAWRLAERTPRPRLAQAGVAALALATLAVLAALHHQSVPTPVHKPSWWMAVPPYLILATMAATAFLGIGTEGWRGRVACWLVGCLSLGFAVQALGDWMRGFRWISLASVPGAVLAAVGVAVVGEGLVRWFRPFARGVWGEATARGLAVALGLVVSGAAAFGGWTYSATFAKKPETTPQDVRQRVNYMTRVGDRLKLEGRIRDVDVDQGAHVWWSRWQMYDIAGLIDVPFAINRFDRSFIQEYVFGEIRPQFVHLHGAWATSSRILSLPEWRANYVEIPGYGAANGPLHVGNHVRRDLFLQTASPFSAEWAVPLSGQVTFAGFEVPSREVALGGAFRIHVGFQTQRKLADTENFHVLVFVADAHGHLASWDAAPGYDWVRPSDWRPDETFVGKYDLRLPADLPTGRYDLGVVVLGPQGVLAPIEAEASGAPRFASGELLFRDVLTVVTGAEATAAAEAALAGSVSAAAAADCDAAEQRWFEARMHLPHDKDWAGQHRKNVSRDLARCFVARAAQAATPGEAVAAITRARGWDWLDPAVLEAGRVLGAQRHAAGEQAERHLDFEAAYRGYADAVAVDPTRSWSRRAAEAMRAQRLQIDFAGNKKERLDRAKAKRPPQPRVPAKGPAKAPPR